MFDQDGNGSICPGELEGALRALGMEHHEAHVKVLLAKADLDGDGKIEVCAWALYDLVPSLHSRPMVEVS